LIRKLEKWKINILFIQIKFAGNLYNHKSTAVKKDIKDLIPFLSALNQAVFAISF